MRFFNCFFATISKILKCLSLAVALLKHIAATYQTSRDPTVMMQSYETGCYLIGFLDLETEKGKKRACNIMIIHYI